MHFADVTTGYMASGRNTRYQSETLFWNGTVQPDLDWLDTTIDAPPALDNKQSFQSNLEETRSNRRSTFPR